MRAMTHRHVKFKQTEPLTFKYPARSLKFGGIAHSSVTVSLHPRPQRGPYRPCPSDTCFPRALAADTHFLRLDS